MSSPLPTTLSPQPLNSTPAMSREQTDPVTKRTAGVPLRPSRSRARTILPRGDHADELQRASPVRLIDVTDQTVVTWNQAAPVAAGLRWHCPPGVSHEVADANPRPPQHRREPPTGTGQQGIASKSSPLGSTAPPTIEGGPCLSDCSQCKRPGRC